MLLVHYPLLSSESTTSGYSVQDTCR